MKSLAVLSLFASLALAQSSSSNTTTNPLIPSGISTTCQNFFVQLNANASLTQCIQPLISATAQIASSAGSATSCPSSITTTLNSICSSSNTCDPTLFGAQLSLFYQACQDELVTQKIPQVIVTYDVLYAFVPLQAALCTKDNSGNYCVANMSSSTTTKRASLYRRDAQQAFRGRYPIPWHTAQPPRDKLCTTCTRNIMNVWITQLQKYPYGPGLNSSSLLAGQSALYNAISQTCGNNFLGGEVQAAGALATGAAPRSADSSFAFAGSAIAAVAAGAAALL
ncbi:hypothetical protein BJV74DRAFT_820453 [Russula compacta]|nr:hypothetical protein BJV74DRAFT_820453 [Russula compacta]